MSIVVTVLAILLRYPYLATSLRACVPDSNFFLNGRLCHCDEIGRWNEANCQIVQRRQVCQPGQVIWQGCNRCICQENGQLSCLENGCTILPTEDRTTSKSLYSVIPWCTPFRSYYVNCSICICPASGRTSDAHCAIDTSCSIRGQPSSSDMSNKKTSCLPKVMYLFPCLHCLCSDDGFFAIDKCVETCQRKLTVEPSRRCIPKTFYRNDCNVCQCPANSIPDDNMCTKSTCLEHSNFELLQIMRSKSYKCLPHRFTKPRCFYCECNPSGTINDNACLELDCFEAEGFKYDIARATCSQGEMVPICMECFCLRFGQTKEEYCSRACSYTSKLRVLEKVINDSVSNDRLIDPDLLKKGIANDLCDPNSIYIDQKRYCLCPENGNTNFNLCVLTEENDGLTRKPEYKITIDFNITCEPSTFVEFDCNSCFCSKKGKVDPKWCTYDDCESKRIIQASHASCQSPDVDHNETCNPGSITNVECNFCICSESGTVKDRVCTKNDCTEFAQTHDNFVCEPLAYYEVDCNVCFCPRDGLKNVARCTKNHCEKSYLRSDVCVPGQLFSDECNVCVCPPNGNKAEKACTNYTCAETAPWKKIFQLSESLLGNQIAEDNTKNLDLCFPGEEFIVGCKLCVCPDMGLKDYATCSPMLCEEEDNTEKPTQIQDGADSGTDRGKGTRLNPLHRETRRRELSSNFNVSQKGPETKCKPGSVYIIECRQCICPFAGSINTFCRDLPKAFHSDHTHLARRGDREIPERSNTHQLMNRTTSQTVDHDHTRYPCNRPGKLMDKCFICDCDETERELIEEHCFKSSDDNCKDAVPSFLD